MSQSEEELWDEGSPCLIEPCPCGEFFSSESVKRGKYPTGQFILTPLPDIQVFTHDVGALIICTSRTRKQVEELIDRQWEFAKVRPCNSNCLGIKSKHLTFFLKSQPIETVRKKAHFSITVRSIQNAIQPQ